MHVYLGVSPQPSASAFSTLIKKSCNLYCFLLQQCTQKSSLHFFSQFFSARMLIHVSAKIALTYIMVSYGQLEVRVI